MENESIVFSSMPIEVADFKDYKLATFLISVLDEYDLKGRMIPKESGEMYHSTIVGFPILAKLVTDRRGNPLDFGDHEKTVVRDRTGHKQVKFGTFPIGSVVSSYIEERKVDGYDGLKSCIMIQAKLWTTRFPAYFAVLDKLWEQNNVKSSWEISVQQVIETAKGRILKVFSFVGNTLLGSNVIGAVPNAGVLEYASVDSETSESTELELASALSGDIFQVSNIENQEQEENKLMNDEKEKVIETVVITEDQATQTETPIAVDTPEVAPVVEATAISDKDEDAKKDKDKKNKCASTDESATIEQSDTENLNATIAQLNSTIFQKDEALLKANEKIQELTSEVSSLTPFKEACETAERERIETETAQKRVDLKAKIEKSKLFSKEEIDSTEISSLIESVNEVAIKSLVADKFMASLDSDGSSKTEAVTETASVQTTLKANINNIESDTGFSIKELINTYSNK